MQNQILDSNLLLENRKRLTVSGVDSVDSFSEQTLKLTVMGTKLVVSGEKIKITSFNKGSGSLIADGKFNEIKFGINREPFFKRLFK